MNGITLVQPEYSLAKDGNAASQRQKVGPCMPSSRPKNAVRIRTLQMQTSFQINIRHHRQTRPAYSVSHGRPSSWPGKIRSPRRRSPPDLPVGLLMAVLIRGMQMKAC